MKFKYEIEADEESYRETLLRDGEVIFAAKFKSTDSGAKHFSGDNVDDITDDLIYEYLDSFKGYDLHRLAKKKAEDE